MFVNVIFNLFIMPLELVFEIIFTIANRVVNNPALSIIALSLAMNFLVLPLYKRADAMQEQERDKVNSMAPWVNHIKKTFKGDERYMMLTTYYRQQNYKPIYALRSSFSLILQIPFFIAAYHYLSNLALLNGESFLFLRNLGAPDQLLTIGSLTINIMPIIMTLINFASAFIYLKGFPLKDKIQTYGIGIIFLILLYNSPSGLVFYWTLNQIFSMLKNIFMKLVKSRTVLNIVFSAVGLVFLIAMIVLGKFETPKRGIVIIAVTIICQLPTIISLIKKKKKPSTKEIVAPKYILFLLGGVFITLFVGLLIPLSVISSSPLEFVTNTATPTTLIIKNVALTAGYFLVWFNVFYYLSNPKGKIVFTYIIWAISGVAVLDYMFFGRNLGTISTYLIFDKTPSFDSKEILFNILLVVVVIVGFCVLMRFAKQIVPYLYLILIVGIVVLSVVDISKISSTLNSQNQKSVEKSSEAVIHLSKTGQNVIVLMLDRAISGYLPYIFDEKPELKEKFDGFTYYPNTLSYNNHTNIAAPALFGGYNYTPLAINERSDVALKDKHDEALMVMPKLFGSHGYKSTIIDPPYVGYKNVIDYSIFNNLENVTALSLEGNYITDEMNEKFSPNAKKTQERNFFLYSVLKVVPLVMQTTIYDEGEYLSSTPRFTINDEFLRGYAIMDALPDITDFTIKENTFLFLENNTAHGATLLQAPEYIPSLEPTTSVEGNQYELDGQVMKMENERQIAHYHVNMAALLKVGEWLDCLKDNGVYDNTRIIIVSDHGWALGQFDYMCMELLDVQNYNPLLLVKDFNSHEFSVDNNFHSNAETVSFATQGIVEYENKPKSDVEIITTSEAWDIEVNNGNVFDTSDGQWLSVHDNIFDANNWAVVNP